MAGNRGGANPNPFLALVIGGLVAIAAVISFSLYSGHTPALTRSADVDLKAAQIGAANAPAPATAR